MSDRRRTKAELIEELAACQARLAEAAQRESEELFRATFEQAAVGIAHVAPDGSWLRVNQRYCDIVGYSRAEMLASTFQGITHPDDLGQDLEFVGRLLAGEIPRYSMEKRYLRKDGSIVWVNLTGALVRDPGGEPAYFIAVVEDVSERKWAEDALRREKERARLYLEIAGVVLLAIGADECITMVNRTGCELLGYEESDLLGRNWFEVCVPGDDREKTRAGFQQLLAGDVEPVEYFENQVVTRDGELRLVAWHNRALTDEEGHIIGTLSSGEDITERRRAQRALRFTQFAVESWGDSAFWIAPDGRFLYVNQKACRALGYSRDQLLGMGVPDIDPGFPAEAWPAHWDELRQKKSMVFESTHRTRDGRDIPVEVSISFQIFEGEEYNFAFARDITERKAAEESLRRSEMRYREILEAIREGYYEVDLAGNMVFANESLERILGYPREDLIGMNNRQYMGEEGARAVFRTFNEVFRTGEPAEAFDWEVVRKDGERRLVETSITLIRGAGGEAVGFRGVVRDITELRSAEEQLRESQKMEAIGRLAGGVAHDFNNQLQVIAMYCELAEGELPAGDPLGDFITEIRTAAGRSASLTRQLLAFSRRQPLEPKVLDLNQTVQEVEKMLRRLVGEDVEVRTVLAEDLGAVHADVGQLEQVLVNLVVNAREAMPSGGRLTIETANVEIDEDIIDAFDEGAAGPHVMVAVSDTGGGMDAATRSKVFEPFFTTKEKGTGLGLATVFGIVKQSGGHIHCCSEPGEGTTFKVYLPRTEEEPTGPAEPVSIATDRGDETVLVAEDEGALRVSIASILESRGYTVLSAANGGEAVALSQRHPGQIELLLTDIVMPGMSGKALVDELETARPEMKVLFMSGYTDNAIVHHGRLDEGTPFLQKPFDAGSLLMKIRQVLEAP